MARSGTLAMPAVIPTVANAQPITTQDRFQRDETFRPRVSDCANGLLEPVESRPAAVISPTAGRSPLLDGQDAITPAVLDVGT